MESGASLYPIALTCLSRRLTVVVGGGAVAERKVQRLLAAGAQVRVVSPQLTPALDGCARRQQVEWLARAYAPGDLAGALLVFAATDDRSVNQQVAREAQERGALCNVVDRAGEGDFHVPAVHEQGGLVVAVNTVRGLPRLAVQVRDWIACNLPEF